MEKNFFSVFLHFFFATQSVYFLNEQLDLRQTACYRAVRQPLTADIFLCNRKLISVTEIRRWHIHLWLANIWWRVIFTLLKICNCATVLVQDLPSFLVQHCWFRAPRELCNLYFHAYIYHESVWVVFCFVSNSNSLNFWWWFLSAAAAVVVTAQNFVCWF